MGSTGGYLNWHFQVTRSWVLQCVESYSLLFFFEIKKCFRSEERVGVEEGCCGTQVRSPSFFAPELFIETGFEY